MYCYRRQSFPRRGTASLPRLVLCLLCLQWTAAGAGSLPETIQSIKPGVVAVGTYMAVRAQQLQPRGSGFAVGLHHVVTNSHVLPPKLDANGKETYAIFLPLDNDRMAMREAQLLRRDDDHDLALLKCSGLPLRPLRLGRSASVREGESVAFTGFPLVGALGLFPATHRGIVSAIAPIAIPAASGHDLRPELIRRLREPFDILQLDATAYPGNSGSPLYDEASGQVIGVINSVYVKRTKEAALTDPSGITYAIPVDHVRDLLKAAGVEPRS
jgi:S1-C subfamily serine protease